ncbi:S26 family signal peptidase [Hamadaea sp. NPDC051192]|uniref:S26 family signal peptidase n=1 Tax=Hamadaea sp. NPDC051192 TaxID=3154940 RepID=UPI0034361F2F
MIWDLLRRRLLIVTVDGHSMLPAYAPGDRLLVRRTPADRVRPGMPVVFRSPAGTPELSTIADVADSSRVRRMLPDDRLLVKRVVAVAGDPVPARLSIADEHARVPPGSLVVLGDNPAVSYDSREFGFLDAALVVGVAVRRLAGAPLSTDQDAPMIG